MGWTFSPPYFSASSETARDVGETLCTKPSLPPHPFEALTVNFDDILQLHQLQHPSQWTPEELPERLQQLNHLLEVFVDDFIYALQCTHPQALLHHSRALLHAIHSVFPAAPDPQGNPDDEPVSLKKLKEGEGVWAFRKEILGWIFDGIHRTIELPPGKLKKIRDAVKTVLFRGHASVSDFQTIVGKLQHACLAIPNGKGLLAPLYKLLPTDHSPATRRKHVQVPPGSDAHNALRDLRTMMKLVANRPTKCSQLIPGWPHFVGFCDACKYGAGGVWLSGREGLHPTVWRVPWPPDITKLYNEKKLSINDLEMAGLLLHYLVLEQITANLTHKHAAAWCDNTSAVSWARRLSSSKSRVGQRLVRALSIRHVTTQSSPLAPWSIAGANNNMADLASRSFKAGGKGNYDLTDSEFLTKFHTLFPLTQNASWHMHTLNAKLSSLVFAELRLEQQPMGSWLRLTTHGTSTGQTGPSLSPTLASPIPYSPTCPNLSSLPSSKPLPIGYEMEMQDQNIELALSEFRKRWQPLPRPSNWTTNPAPRTKSKHAKTTGQLSSNK